MTDTENSDTSIEQKTAETIEIAAPKYKLKKLIPKMENESISEKEKARRERLSQQFKDRHAKQRAEKEAFEKEQLAKIEKRLSVKVRASKIKEKIKQIQNDSDTETDEETLNEYLEFKKFKKNKNAPILKKNDSDDEKEDAKVIQKTKKATQVLEAVSKLDHTISQLNGGYVNPYLAFFNNKNR